MDKIEINIPYIAEIDGKAIPTQGVTIRVPSNIPVRVENDAYGNTQLLVNEYLMLPTEKPEPKEKPKAGYLSGVPLDIGDIDTVGVNAPTMGSKVNG